jgi:hypothetical protein
LEGVPAIREAFASGELSYSKVRAVTRVEITTPAQEAELVDFARVATTAQLESTVRAYRKAIEAPEVPAPNAVHLEWDDANRGVLRADLTPEDAAVVFTVLDAEAERLAEAQLRESGSAEPLSQRRAAALVALAEQAQADRADERYLVLVHAELDTLAGRIDNGPALDTATIEALLCDQPAALVLRGRDGNPLFLGRTKRSLNRALRRALHVRDEGRCQFPGCATTVGLHGHHIAWWDRDRGRTDITNLVLLCRFHHRLVHKGLFIVQSDGRGGIEFRTADGQLLTTRPNATSTTTIEAANEAAGTEVVAAPAGGTHERLDRPLAVDALVSWLSR